MALWGHFFCAIAPLRHNLSEGASKVGGITTAPFLPMPTTPPPPNSKGEKLAQRLSYILALLHQGDMIDKRQLARSFQVDVRTIERDLNERLYGVAERNTAGHWQLTHAARSTIPTRHLHAYAALVGTQHLFPDGSLRFLLEQLDVPEPQRAMQVHPVSGEDLNGQNLQFTQLQAAIQARHECHFVYKDKPRHAQPYRLIHNNGVWYLAAVEGGLLKNFSFTLIQGLQVDTHSHFIPDPAHQAYIDNKDDIWFTQKTTEVLLRVSPEVARYFTRRNQLPQQHNRQQEDGSLLVSTQINHTQQLFPIVRYWLPHVRIVQPTDWHEAVLDTLRQAVAQWEQ